MSLRPAVPVVLALATVLAACGSESAVRTASPATAYVAAVQAALDPAGRLAQIVAEAIDTPPAPWPDQEYVDGLVESAEERLAELQTLRLDHDGLRRQRDRLVSALVPVVTRLQEAADRLRRRDRAALRSGAGPLFDALRRLPSAG
jgi:hypothetical protein